MKAPVEQVAPQGEELVRLVHDLVADLREHLAAVEGAMPIEGFRLQPKVRAALAAVDRLADLERDLLTDVIAEQRFHRAAHAMWVEKTRDRRHFGVCTSCCRHHDEQGKPLFVGRLRGGQWLCLGCFTAANADAIAATLQRPHGAAA